MKRLLGITALCCLLCALPATAQALDPVAQIITSVNMVKTGDNVSAEVVFARSYGTRIYRVYYNTENSADLSTWEYATFTGTPLANTVAVQGLSPQTDYYFKVRVSSQMGSMLVDSDVWKLSTISGDAGVVSKSYVPVTTSLENPVTISAPFTSDAGSSTAQVTVPAAVTGEIQSVEIESRLANGNTNLTITPRNASGTKITSTSAPLLFVLPYDESISARTLNLSYTHDGSTYTVKQVPDQGDEASLLASDGFYWRTNNVETFIFGAQKFSTLTQANDPQETPVPASSSRGLMLFLIGAVATGVYFSKIRESEYM